MRDTTLNITEGPRGTNDHESIDLNTLMRLSSVKGETSNRVYDAQLDLPAVHLLIKHNIKKLEADAIIPEGKLIHSEPLSQLYNQNLATHNINASVLEQVYTGPKLLYPMIVEYAKDEGRRQENQAKIDKAIKAVIKHYNDRDHDYYAVMCFGSHWYLILLTTSHRRNKEAISPPSTLEESGVPTGGRITIVYQSIDKYPHKEIARHMHKQLMKEMTRASPLFDLRDVTCSVKAVNNPLEKERLIELNGKQQDKVSCGMYLGDAIRQVYTIKHNTGMLPENLTNRTDQMMECWRRRILKDMWPGIRWSKDILKEYFYKQRSKEE